MERIDLQPTHSLSGYKYRIGYPLPFGATFVPGGVNFSVFSRYGTGCTLVLFKRGESKPFLEIPFEEEFRIGDVFMMIVFGLDYENIEYGYRMDGPYNPYHGHRFDLHNILLDPYAWKINGRDYWGHIPSQEHGNPHRGSLAYSDFDWERDHPSQIPIEELIIYEMHVRGFTAHPSSHAKHRGTFSAIREKIPYLQSLGVNCVELMPIFEFDEFENERLNPETGERLFNYWGYSTIGFFAPKAGYAATGALGMQMDELKTVIKELHEHGIEVILDVVFNHTAEGGETGPVISFKGLDNKTYYMLAPDGNYLNFSGTGNTLNCNNPIVRNFVLDCLRYWAAEYHIDGFRFDLASILGRDTNGHPLSNPPLLETLAYDPILAHCKLIAEAWDAGGLYQVGTFPSYGRWAEWNGKYRDTLRKFLKADAGQVEELALRLKGSPDLYGGRGPTASINFITCHDGFTLHDLVSYNEKHNFANGEDNRDGANDNHSWNCGEEGPSDHPEVNALRLRQMKNAIAMLMVSQGVPMILMGDEVSMTKSGNNNTYCHDNTLNWFDWSRLKTQQESFGFFQRCIAFRKAHPVLRQQHYLRESGDNNIPELSWHGTEAWRPDWSYHSHTLAFMLHLRLPHANDTIYVAMNMYWERLTFQLPRPPDETRWHLFADTGLSYPDDITEPGTEKLLKNQHEIVAVPRSVIILVGK